MTANTPDNSSRLLTKVDDVLRLGLSRFPKESVPTLVALLGVFAGLSYGLLSLACTLVYDALGIEPREVGLGSGAVLQQAGRGAIMTGVLFFLTQLAFAILTPGLVRRLPPASRAPTTHMPLLRRLSLVLACAISSVGILFMTTFAVVKARRDMSAGHTPQKLADVLPVPWHASIANVQWTGDVKKSPDLPPCALYLGTANSTPPFSTEPTTMGLVL